MSWKEYKKILNNFCFKKSTIILACLIFGAVCGVIYLVENEIKEERRKGIKTELTHNGTDDKYKNQQNKTTQRHKEHNETRGNNHIQKTRQT